LFFVLEFINGGDLFYHLHNTSNGIFPIELARFYTAELVVVLQYLHSFKIIFRDLKLPNILLTFCGHIVLCDFGLAKQLCDADDCTSSFCGTDEYLAPEILVATPYSYAVDWWALGSLLCEMISGSPPFYNSDRQLMFDMICNDTFVVPSSLTPEAADLCQRLLQKEPRERMQTISCIREHAFFTHIDWTAVESQTVTPPFLPPVNSREDVALVKPSPFRPYPSPIIMPKNSASTDHTFDGFDFTNPEFAESLLSWHLT
jgi:serum/glucocorticoid-regulated kinase 2